MSELGDPEFSVHSAEYERGAASMSAQAGDTRGGFTGVHRRAAVPGVAAGWGRGPIGVDKRKFRFDVNKGMMAAPLSFSVSKADRMDADQAGDLLNRIHQLMGIPIDEEARLVAFDRALFFEHTVNGASLLQPGRGTLKVDGVSFDIAPIKIVLGVDQRRFFRAFADDIAEVNKYVISTYDPYDPVSAEMHGQLLQVAVERGLQKFPHLAHDSSDAGVLLSHDERLALMASKVVVLPAKNNADALPVARAADVKDGGYAK